MGNLSPTETVTLLSGLAILLGAAMTFGELARRIRQPAIVGETIAGILLGPSVLGLVSPSSFTLLFPKTGPAALALETFVTISVILLLLVAGMEMDLSAMHQHGRKALLVSSLGIIVPFAVGGTAAYLWPDAAGRGTDADEITFALFFATALSISALPVIAKTLMDLNLLRTDLGVLVMTGAMVNDLLGWLIFSVVLSLMGSAAHGYSFGATIGMTVLVLGVVFLVIRPMINRVMPWVQTRLVWPGGVLSFTLVLAFAFSALTEAIGIHAVFGAFLIGIAFGDSPHVRQRTREIIHYFVMHIFAPIFFAAIGLYADIVGHFNLPLVLFVLVLATVGKVGGGYLGSRIGGLSGRRSWAVGFGLNARGAMGIILALIALQNRVISEEAFVALVVMALVTSVLSGPVMDRLIPRRRRRTLAETMEARTFVPELAAKTMNGAIEELAALAARSVARPVEEITDAVMRREKMGLTVVGHGIAIPHARIAKLKTPVAVVGRSPAGIPCASADQEPVRLLFLLLTPRDDPTVQLELIADIAAAFGEKGFRERALAAKTYSEFLAELTVQSGAHGAA